MARRRIIKVTPLEDGQQPAIDLPTGGKMEFPEPAKLIEETVELDAAEAVLLDQLVKDRLQEAQQPQEVQEAQGTGEPLTDDQRRSAVDAAHEAAAAIDSFLQEPGVAEAVAQQEELQRLMQLPLSQIETLPQEKRELVWQELARQIVETPGFVDSMTAITAASKKAMEAAARLAEWATQPAEESPLFKFAQWAAQPAGEIEQRLHQMAENATRTIKGAGAAFESIRKSIVNLHISEDTVEALKTWAILAPYIEAEADAHPEKYGEQATEPANANALIAAAARRAREDGKEIPPLKAEEREPEQLQFEFPTDKEETRRKHIEEAHKRHELARQEGALIAAGTRLATIAEKGLGFDYFTSAVCKLLPAGIENFILDDQGRINLYDLTGDDKSIQDVLQEVDELHTAFLMWLLGLAWNNSDIRETNSGNAIMPVYLPAVLEEMRIDPRPREWDSTTKQLKKRDSSKALSDLRRDKFMEFISPLRNVAAFFGEDLYQIVGFYSYNAESETMYITAPYMFRLVEYAKLHATKHGAIKNIFHADIMTENQTAVEIANRIAMGLITRGVTTADSSTYQNETPRKPIKKKTTKTAPDGTKTVEELTFAPEPEPTVTKTRTDENGIITTVTGTPRKKEKAFSFRIKFSTLIADCPQLQREIDEIRSGSGADKSQRINKKLKDTFTAAIRIIMEKSEIPKYYKKLTIRTGRFDVFKAPTNSTLSDQLIITHYGKDPNFSE